MKKLILFVGILIFSTGLYSQEYSGEWPHGTEFTAYATPEPGWEFVNWTENGNVISTENPYTFTVTGPRNLIANFRRLTYLINIQVNPQGSGTVEGSGEHPPGEEVMLHAIPNDNYKFDSYLDLTSGETHNQNPWIFLADNDRDIEAKFSQTSVLPKHWLWTILIVSILWIVFFIINKTQSTSYSPKNKKLWKSTSLN